MTRPAEPGGDPPAVPARWAAVDCGTNSIRLLIAEERDGRLRDVLRETRLVRLGEGVDRTGMLSAAALDRTRDALVHYAQAIADHQVQAVRMVATSATRDAGNRDAFVEMVLDTLGVEPTVIDASTEAELSYRGALASLPALTPPVLVVDIGGGSTELAAVLVGVAAGGQAEPNATLHSHSMAIGCVRMTERHLHGDPPSGAEVAALQADVRAALDAARPDVAIERSATVVAVAGTALTVAALATGASGYDESGLHATTVRTEAVASTARRLLAMTAAERGALAVIEPGRADVIAAGASILAQILDAAGVDRFVACAHDLLDGVVSLVAETMR